MEITRDLLVEAILAEGKDTMLEGPKLLEIANAIADRFRLETEPLSESTSGGSVSAVQIYDLLKEQDYLYPGGKRKTKLDRKGKPVRRDPRKVTHIVLHQTAVEYGVSKQQIAASNGDAELALARRFLDVACHIAACRSGFIVLAHDLDVQVNHGNGFNSFSIGIEVDGRYCGIEDDPSTVAREDLQSTWGGLPTVLTSRTVRAARAAVGYAVTAGRKRGMPLTHIVAHRQSSGQRRSDPGQELYQRVILNWAVPELGLKTEPHLTLPSEKSGPGRPVPLEWDPEHGLGSY